MYRKGKRPLKRFLTVECDFLLCLGMSFLGESVAGVIIEGILSFVDYPGAWVHWKIRRKKISFMGIVERYFGINLILSLLVYGVVGMAVWGLLELL